MKKIIFPIVFILFFCVGFLGYVQFCRPAISVVMSTYNRVDFLPRAIDSILNQTFTDFEFIIINDGSPDETAKVLNLFAMKDKRIRVITNEQNKGLIYSLNRGLEEARGKYIARMDDDDIALPTRFEKQYAFMEKNPDFAVVGSWIGHPDGGQKWSFHDETNPEKVKMYLYLNTVPISHPASFLRRSFLNKHNIRYNDTYKAAEDRKFWLDIVDADGKIGNVAEVLLLFRFHGTNPYEYYVNQQINSRKFFNEILERFGTKEEFEGLNQCQVIKKMAKRNKDIKLISQSLLEEHIAQQCPQDDSNPVNHKQWSDYFVFDGNRVCRHQVRTECATIVKKTPDKITIQWDRWEKETFHKKNGTWVFQ